MVRRGSPVRVRKRASRSGCNERFLDSARCRLRRVSVANLPDQRRRERNARDRFNLAEGLTCDRMVTYSGPMSKDEDRVFKALGDPTRRFLLDLLFQSDGRTLTELESELEMTRFGVMKHLRVLEDAGLVVTRRQGREKLHFLNPVPIRLIHDRWIDKYTERQVSALADLKTKLEETA